MKIKHLIAGAVATYTLCGGFDRNIESALKPEHALHVVNARQYAAGTIYDGLEFAFEKMLGNTAFYSPDKNKPERNYRGICTNPLSIDEQESVLEIYIQREDSGKIIPKVRSHSTVTSNP